MNESIPSSAHPAQEAQNPRIWFRVSLRRPLVVTVFTAVSILCAMRHATAIVLCVVAAVLVIHGQEGPRVPAETLLPREVLVALDQELSGTAAKDHVARLTQMHRVPASPGFHEAIEYVMSRAV